MTIQKKPLGFHPPVSLAHDAGQYCIKIQKVIDTRSAGTGRRGEHFALLGNDHAALEKLRTEAAALEPFAQKIANLEAQLSQAYRDYDQAAVDLWHRFTEARDTARDQGERHGFADVLAVTQEYNYHAGRATRHASAHDEGTGSAK